MIFNKKINFIGAIFVLSFFYSEPSYALNYFRCETTKDCARTYAGCGRYDSVHRRYVELYEAKARKGDTMSFCTKPKPKDEELKLKGIPVCIKSVCHLRLSNKKQ